LISFLITASHLIPTNHRELLIYLLHWIIIRWTL